MTPNIALDRLKPRWTQNAGALMSSGATLRSLCLACGTPLRVDPADIVARHGPGHRLIDATERCRMVGCTGAAIYLAARSYGRPWIALVEDPALTAAHHRVTGGPALL